MGIVFFHVDLDAFYASVEQRDNPQYKNTPLIIGGKGPRSVVSTCSYEARKFGVHSAMSMDKALKLCPNATVISPNMKKYSKESSRIMNILRKYTPNFLQISIDEAFLEMTGTEKLFGPPKDTARQIKKEIESNTGLTVSIGISRSRFIAKMASDFNKPNGLTVISPGQEQKFIDTIGLKKIWGIGKSSLQKLNFYHLFTPQDIRNCSIKYLEKTFSNSFGQYLYKACRGIDPGIYSSESKNHTISTETTFPKDVTKTDILEKVLLSMSRQLALRAIEEEVIAQTISIKLRWGINFRTITVQKTPEIPLLNADQIFNFGKKMLHEKWNEPQGIRLIGLGLGNLYKGKTPIQDNLFMEKEKQKRKIDTAVENLYKQGVLVVKATEIKKNNSTKQNSINTKGCETMLSDEINK